MGEKERGVKLMKQLIVMISMIMLGVAIAGMVGQFTDSANTLSTKAIAQIQTLDTMFSTGGGSGGTQG